MFQNQETISRTVSIDFQNILEIVIAEFLGFEKPNKGIFDGEVEGKLDSNNI